MQLFKIYFTVLLSISLASTAPVNDQNKVEVTKYEYVTDPNGGYYFEYETSDGQSRLEEGTSRISAIDGTTIIAVIGRFSYLGDDGKRYSVQYTSDEYGYRASGDHLNKQFTDVTPPSLVEDLSANAILSLVG